MYTVLKDFCLLIVYGHLKLLEIDVLLEPWWYLRFLSLVMVNFVDMISKTGQ